MKPKAERATVAGMVIFGAQGRDERCSIKCDDCFADQDKELNHGRGRKVKLVLMRGLRLFGVEDTLRSIYFMFLPLARLLASLPHRAACSMPVEPPKSFCSDEI